MAASKVPQSTSFSFEIEKGVDKDGKTTYSKKSFGNLKTDASPDDVLEVFDAFSSALSVSTRDCFINESSKLVKSE